MSDEFDRSGPLPILDFGLTNSVRVAIVRNTGDNEPGLNALSIDRLSASHEVFNALAPEQARSHEDNEWPGWLVVGVARSVPLEIDSSAADKSGPRLGKQAERA